MEKQSQAIRALVREADAARPGGGSALCHAHKQQDEFLHVLEGEPTLHTGAGARASRRACAPGSRPERATRTNVGPSRGPPPQSPSTTSLTMRARSAAPGSRPRHAAMLSSRCFTFEVAGSAQVTAGCETANFRKS